jgi:hypothetical protein
VLRSLVQVPIRAIDFFNLSNPPAALEPGVHSDSIRNEYQKIFLGGGGGRL